MSIHQADAPTLTSRSTFLGEGSYGCVYYPGISCAGKQNKKRFITKIQDINFYSDNEKSIGIYIKNNIANYKKYFSPIVKFCIVKFNTLEKSHLDIAKCNILFEEYNELNAHAVYHADHGNHVNRVNYNNSIVNNKYILMYSPYIKSYTIKDFYIDHDFEFTFNILNHIYKTLYSLSLLNKVGIIHNDLHMGNILISLKNNNPVIIDFGLSLNINNCYKLSKDYIDFQYVKKFTFDYRNDSYHFNIEKRFISFIIFNKLEDFTVEIYDNNDINAVSKEAINYFIADTYNSMIDNEEISRFFNNDEMSDYKKALARFYYQFLDKHKYPKYNSIVKYLLDYVHAYNDLYSLTINLVYLYHLKDINMRERGREGAHFFLKNQEQEIIEFFIQLYKKVIYPDPTMRLKITEVLDLYKFIISFIKNYNLKTVKNTIRLDFITSLVKFLKSQNISIKIVFYKKFAFLNFNLLCSQALFETVKHSSIKF